MYLTHNYTVLYSVIGHVLITCPIQYIKCVHFDLFFENYRVDGQVWRIIGGQITYKFSLYVYHTTRIGWTCGCING